MATHKHLCNFHIYRYQILPTTQDLEPFQTQFDPPILSLEDLRHRKNDFFAQVLQGEINFVSPRTELIHKIVAVDSPFFVIRLGANRGIIRSTRNFEKEELENWPSIFIVLNNAPDVQKVAIEIKPSVFYRTTTVSNILEKSLNFYLAQYQLETHFQPTFEKNHFWIQVEKYKNRIIQVEFKMISPNLSGISDALEFDLGEIHKRTNTQETTLQLDSGTSGALTISQNDTFINSLVGYSAEGGGNITLKVKGISKKIKTSDSIIEQTIDEIELSKLSQENVVPALKELLK
jgi:hypothetical protein